MPIPKLLAAKKLALKYPPEKGNMPNVKLEYLTQVTLTATPEGIVEMAASVTSIFTDETGALIYDTRRTRDSLPSDLDGNDIKGMALDKCKADQEARKGAETHAADRDERAQKAAERKQKIVELEGALKEQTDKAEALGEDVQVLRGQTITLENRLSDALAQIETLKGEKPNV